MNFKNAPRRALAEPVLSGSAEAPRDALERYSKRFGPGDMDGAGAQNLLGRPSSEKVVTLVRETAQNSWDALDGDSAEFEMRLRQATPAMLSALRQRIFADLPPRGALPLNDVLAREELWVLEISDRGTRGLEGPTRNDIRVAEGIRTGYADFVLTLGAPRDVERGGGTYGFGKTIAYTASEAATILIWSRARSEKGSVVERLIASAIGRSYMDGERKHTGRHWWGLVSEGHVDPVVGSEARGLADQIFVRGFEGDARGTSLLVISPEFGEVEEEGAVRPRTPREYAQALSDAAMANLWPKLVHDPGRPSMSVKVFFEDEDLSPGPVEHDPLLSHFAKSLSIVRALQRGEEPPLSIMSEHWPIIDGRRGPDRPIGHLAVTRDPETAEILERLKQLVPGEEAQKGRHLSLMRHPELVVKYRPGRESAQEGYGWAAVFKPVEEMDDAFADAEPPAHDDWLPEAVRDPRHKSPVNIALTKTKKSLDEWANPRVKHQGTTVTGRSAAALADALGSLMAGLPGTGPSTTGGKAKSGASRSSGKATIVSSRQLPHRQEGFTQWDLAVALVAKNPQTVRARVGIATAGEPERDADVCAVEAWDEEDFVPSSEAETTMEPGQISRLSVRVVEGAALDVRLEVIK